MDVNNLQDTAKIKCPNCGVVLTVKYFSGIESKTITCPVCKKANVYTNYRKPASASKPLQTDDEEKTVKPEEKTIPAQNPVGGIGRLLQPETGKVYLLKMGLNIIGRKAHTSSADIQLDTDDKTISRNHCAIEVKKLSNGSYIHYLSNSKNKNATYVNGEELKDGDRIILQGGESIKLGNSTISFIKPKLSDETATLL